VGFGPDSGTQARPGERVLAVAGAQVVGEGLHEPIEFVGHHGRQLRSVGGRAEAAGKFVERRSGQQEGGEIGLRFGAFDQTVQTIEPLSLLAVQARGRGATFFEGDGAGIGQEVVGVQRYTLGVSKAADRSAASDS
jgi:hypothetical protein